MTAVPLDDIARDDLGPQLAALREDIARLTTHAQQAAARVTQLEAALRLVRDLMRDLPAHDNVSTVAVRLRAHFDYLAGSAIDDALTPPPVAVPDETPA